jgi:hypothetical protein
VSACWWAAALVAACNGLEAPDGEKRVPTEPPLSCDAPFDPSHVWISCRDVDPRPPLTDAGGGVTSLVLPDDAFLSRSSLTGMGGALDNGLPRIAFLQQGVVVVRRLDREAAREIEIVADVSTRRTLDGFNPTLEIRGGQLAVFLSFTCTQAADATCGTTYNYSYEMPLLVDVDACTAVTGVIAKSGVASCGSYNFQNQWVFLAGKNRLGIQSSTGTPRTTVSSSCDIFAGPDTWTKIAHRTPVEYWAFVGNDLYTYAYPPRGGFEVLRASAAEATSVAGAALSGGPVDGIDATDRFLVWTESGSRTRVLDLASQTVIDLPSPEGRPGPPAVLGSWVARVEGVGGGTDVYVYNVDSGQDTPVATSAADATLLGLSPYGVCWLAGRTVTCDTRFASTASGTP